MSGRTAKAPGRYPLAHERPGLRLVVAMAALLTLTAAGTIGYVLVEGAPWFDALYMTVITLSTIGYGEIFPLSKVGRVFTMGLIFSGVGTAAYFVATVAQLLAVDVLSKLVPGSGMEKTIERMSKHIIVCGYGRFGQIVVAELGRGKVPVLIIEHDPGKRAELEQSGHPYLVGDATSDEVLLKAGLDRACAVVAGTSSDPDNVFITLAARERRKDVQIHARGETSETIRRLKQAGANYVLSAYQMAGVSLAASILRPSVAQFLEIAQPGRGRAIDLEEVRVMPNAKLVGRTLVEIERGSSRLRIVALMRGDRTILIPEPTLQVDAGDYLVVMGERLALEQLATMASTS